MLGNTVHGSPAIGQWDYVLANGKTPEYARSEYPENEIPDTKWAVTVGTDLQGLEVD